MHQCSGSVRSVGGTLRIEVTSNDTVVIPNSDSKIIKASKLGSSWGWAHFATYHTKHDRANYAICESKDNDRSARVKNHIDYEVAYGSKRSASKVANHLVHNCRAIYGANNEKKVNTSIASCGTMENHVVYGGSYMIKY